jgi:hypothetical protein
MGGLCIGGAGTSRYQALFTVDTSDGTVTPITTVTHSAQYNMAFDEDGNLYFANINNDSVMKWDPLTNILSVVAGTGVSGSAGDGGPGLSAQVNNPWSVAVTSDGGVVITDHLNYALRKVWP